MNDQMQAEQAAAELSGRKPGEPIQETTEDPIPDPLPKNKPPLRRFVWVNEDHLTVEDWLAGQAHAVLQIVPGLTVQFQEAKEIDREAVDSLVNGLGSKFVMKGLVDGVMATQVRRASNMGLLCQSITHLNGERWMPDSSLEERWKAIKGKGQLMVDKLIEALYEFSDQLLHTIDSGNLGNS